ncbi:MAG: HEAT repeat domain-containing protein [Planctomycetota bacterium]
MNRTFWLCAGLLGGVLLTLGVQYAVGAPEETARAAPSREDPALAVLRAENDRLREEVRIERMRLDRIQNLDSPAAEKTAKLQRELAPEPPEAPADTPPTDDEIMKAVGVFGAELGEIMQGRGEEAKQKLRDVFARGGEHAVDLLVEKFEDDATDIGLRVAIAHALAQSGNPDAIASLTKVLANPAAGMLELRLATHGLAFSDAPGTDDALLRVAHQAADTGARANAAFGLARRKNPEGVGLYMKATDEALANRDPTALQYLGGFTLLGDEALPLLRERLLTYTEPQAAITLIEILKSRGDKGSIENLRKLAGDAGRPESIRRSAEGALKVLEAPPK